jgi:hypothetical protein
MYPHAVSCRQLPWPFPRVATVVVALMLSSLAPALPANGQGTPINISRTGTYIHSASRMTYPPAVGRFTRTYLRQYDDAGYDVSVGYEFRSSHGRIVATVYVYPAPSVVGSPSGDEATIRAELTDREFRARQLEILQATPGAKLIGEGNATLTQGAVRYTGKKAEYRLERLFSDQRQQLGSELYLFCFVGGRWTLKYRFSYPVAFDAEREIATFMQGLAVTIPPEQ